MKIRVRSDRYLALGVCCLLLSMPINAVFAQALTTADELIERYRRELAAPSPLPATRGLDVERGIAGVRQGGNSRPATSITAEEPSAADAPAVASAAAPADQRQGSGVDFHNIVFASGSYSIPSNAYSQLDEIGSALSVLGRSFPQMQFVIEGHTDSLGDADANQVLSFNRANAIRRYLLVKHDIPSSHIQAIGMGELQPMASNATRQGRALNRRVSIRNLRTP